MRTVVATDEPRLVAVRLYVTLVPLMAVEGPVLTMARSAIVVGHVNVVWTLLELFPLFGSDVVLETIPVFVMLLVVHAFCGSVASKMTVAVTD